jgi:hypothetical protein
MLAEAVTWSKQNLADLTQQADNVKIRPTEEGTQYPAPIATLPVSALKALASRITHGCS